ncbi:MAG TPA: hypothetical protein VJO53_05760 [Candidatus Acidoferrales bacterium]|nr:hypothetical protein [Candidatus Acidoferrales bacterium]
MKISTRNRQKNPQIARSENGTISRRDVLRGAVVVAGFAGGMAETGAAENSRLERHALGIA